MQSIDLLSIDLSVPELLDIAKIQFLQTVWLALVMLFQRLLRIETHQLNFIFLQALALRLIT